MNSTFEWSRGKIVKKYVFGEYDALCIKVMGYNVSQRLKWKIMGNLRAAVEISLFPLFVAILNGCRLF